MITSILYPSISLLFISCDLLAYYKYFLIERYKHYVKFGNIDKDRNWALQIDVVIAFFAKVPPYSDNSNFYSLGKNKREYAIIGFLNKSTIVFSIICVLLLLILLCSR